MQEGARATCGVMNEFLSTLPGWFYILLGVGVFDACLQWFDYRCWREEQNSEEAGE